MDNVSILIAGGMRARTEALDLLANNIANAGTPGFKADREFYDLYMSTDAAAGDGRPASVPDVRQRWTDLSQGALKATGNPTDLAIAGNGFFALEGNGGPLLTRNGNFRLASDGTLVGSEGQKVRAQGGGALKLDPRLAFEIAPDGTVSQSGRNIGRIDVIEPEAGATFEKLGNGLLKVQPPDARMRTAVGAEIRQGQLESANFATPEAAVRLVTVMRHFEMLQRAAALTGEMGKQATEQVARATA
jgi:flagellar basal body rod protein FlgG